MVGILAFCCMQAVGEMTTMFPGGGFSLHANRFCSKSFADIISLNYYIAWVCVAASEYNTLSSIMTFYTENVPIYGWILIFWVFFLSFQLLGVDSYGEAEYWLALVKIIGLTAFYIFALIYMCGGVKGTPAFGFQYWKNPGAITHGFKGVATVFIMCSSSYVGIEAIAITAAETKNPTKSIPSAIKKTLIRIVYIYVCLAFFYGVTVSSNDPMLNNKDRALKSPMTIAIVNAGWTNAGYLVNTFILICGLSAINSSLYIASRTLLQLARDGIAPKIFSKTSRRGVPVAAVLATNALALISLMNVSVGASVVYGYITNLSGVSTFLVWAGISLTHIRFRQGWIKQGKSLDELIFRDRFYPYTSYLGLFGNIFFALVQGWSTIYPFRASNFVVAYILIPVSILAYIILKIKFKTKFIKLDDMDFEEGRSAVIESALSDQVVKSRGLGF